MSKFENQLFELSWEVCNKVGGIHTVIASKIFEAQNNFSNYICVGPYKSQDSNVFDEQKPPLWMEEGIKRLKEEGIFIHYGTWNIEGFPQVILVDYLCYSPHINDIKKQIWELWGVDSLGTQWYDVDEVLLWSWVCGVVIEKLVSMSSQSSDSRTLVHAHEWLTGGTIAYLSSIENSSNFKTLFTTHATVLGRAMNSLGYDINYLEKKEPLELAVELGVKTKFQIENSMANNCSCFTTVSDITAREVKLVHGMGPDVITYNGFDSKIEDLYVLEKQAISSRNRIDNFLMNYFYDFFNYDYNNTNLLYTSGRYELKNKGVDLIVDSLSELNKELKKNNSSKKIIFWFMLMFGKFEYDDKVSESINNSKSNKVPQHLGYAPLSPYKIPLDNELIQQLVSKKLLNNEEDKVKVIVTPNIFNGYDDLIGMDYYKLIAGFDLGVFPSMYEPWGYTPAESLAYGVPAITTNKTGIGEKSLDFKCDESFMIINREKSFEESKEELKNKIYSIINLEQHQKLNKKMQAKICSQKFSWKVFYNNYLKAYREALKK